MRIGIFGGSFDPVHFGHLLLAEYCRESCQLDEVRLVPAAIPPHKQGQYRAADEHRLQMLKLAIGGHPALTTWDVEIERGGVSYTIDTLNALRKQQPDDELFFLIGADSLHDLPTWHKPDAICAAASLVAVNRPGSAPVDFEVLADLVPAPRRAAFSELIVTMPQIGISSTEIRRRVGANLSIRYQTPRAVEEYIREAGLYKNAGHDSQGAV